MTYGKLQDAMTTSTKKHGFQLRVQTLQWYQSSTRRRWQTALDFDPWRSRFEDRRRNWWNCNNLQRPIESLCRMQQFIAESKNSHEEHRRAIADQGKKTEQQFTQITEMFRSIMHKEQPTNNLEGIVGVVPTVLQPTARNVGNHAGSQDSSGNPSAGNSWSSDSRGGNTLMPKLDFPTFDGSKPRSWVVRKADKYFKIFGVPDLQKVEVAAMFVSGRADTWLHGVLWTELQEVVCERFGEKQGSEVIEEFNKLVQKDDLEEYNEKFEELRAYMLASDSHLP